jgi:hypothetical protein
MVKNVVVVDIVWLTLLLILFLFFCFLFFCFLFFVFFLIVCLQLFVSLFCFFSYRNSLDSRRARTATIVVSQESGLMAPGIVPRRRRGPMTAPGESNVAVVAAEAAVNASGDEIAAPTAELHDPTCVVSSVLAVLRRHRMHSGVQVMGILALCSLSLDYGMQVRVAGLGGVQVVLAGMGLHAAHRVVQEHGCRALANLSVTGVNKPIIAQQGGVAAILAAMRRHAKAAVGGTGTGGGAGLTSTAPLTRGASIARGWAKLRQLVRHYRIQEFGARCLCNLAMNPSVQDDIIERGGIGVVCNAMRILRDFRGVQEYGIRCLCNLAFLEHNARLVCDAGGAQAVLDAMRTHMSNPIIQELGARAIVNMSHAGDNGIRIVQDGGITVLLTACHRHMHNVHVAAPCLSALANIGVRAPPAAKIMTANDAHALAAEVAARASASRVEGLDAAVARAGAGPGVISSSSPSPSPSPSRPGPAGAGHSTTAATTAATRPGQANDPLSDSMIAHDGFASAAAAVDAAANRIDNVNDNDDAVSRPRSDENTGDGDSSRPELGDAAASRGPAEGATAADLVSIQGTSATAAPPSSANKRPDVMSPAQTQDMETMMARFASVRGGATGADVGDDVATNTLIAAASRVVAVVTGDPTALERALHAASNRLRRQAMPGVAVAVDPLIDETVAEIHAAAAGGTGRWENPTLAPRDLCPEVDPEVMLRDG